MGSAVSRASITMSVRRTCQGKHQVLVYDILPFLFLSWCFTSTESRWPIRDGDRVGRGRQSEGSTAETARKGPERPWTAARTMEVLKRCPLAIAQRLVHCAIVSTAVPGQSHKDNVRCTAVEEQLGQLKQRKSSFLSPAPHPSSKIS